MCAALRRWNKPGERVVLEVPGVCKPEECQRLMESAIKYILFGRNIIPYPYKHLFAVVNRQINEDMTSREIIFEQLHKRKAAAMIAKIDGILKGFDKEFNSNSDVKIREIAFVIGPTIHCPKEVYLFKFPETYPNKDLTRDVKSDLMRHVVLNPDFTNFITKSIQLTNMYVMVKKPKGDLATWICPKPNYKIPARAPRVEIELLCDSPKCGNTRIDGLLEQIRYLKVSKPRDSIMSQQNVKLSIAAQKQSYSDENDMLDEINTFVSSLWTSNEASIISPNVRKTDKENKDVLHVLTGNTCVQNVSLSSDGSSGGDGNNVPCSSGAVATEENSNNEVSGKEVLSNKTDEEKQEDEAATLDNELIWYITSEYLPCFKEPTVTRCPTNKRTKH